MSNNMLQFTMLMHCQEALNVLILNAVDVHIRCIFAAALQQSKGWSLQLYHAAVDQTR